MSYYTTHMRGNISQELGKYHCDLYQIFIIIVKISNNDNFKTYISQYYCIYRSNSLSQYTIMPNKIEISLI